MTPDQIEQMRADVATGTPGPWWTDGRYSGQEMGCAVIAARTDSGLLPGNPTRGMVAWSSAVLNTDARKCEANARRIARVPEMEAHIETQAAEIATARALIEALEGEQARADKAEAERDAAIAALGEAACLRGKAEGKLLAAETPGVLEGWKRRAEAAEAEIARLQDALEAEKASHKITLDRESAAYVRHDARIEAAEAVQEAVARAALEAAAEKANEAWMDGVPVAEIAAAIRTIDPEQIVKEVRRMLRRTEAAEAEAARLRDMLEDALKFWIALDPEAEVSAEVLSMRAALKEPKT